MGREERGEADTDLGLTPVLNIDGCLLMEGHVLFIVLNRGKPHPR